MSNARNLANLLGTGTTIASAKIADDAITNAKILNDAVTGAKIEDNPTIAGNLTIAGTTTAQGETAGFVSFDKIQLNATDGSATDAGDNLILNGTDATSANADSSILFEGATGDPNFVSSGGKVLQVVYATMGDRLLITTSGNFTAVTGLEATITPSSASSKILVQFCLGKVSHASNSTGVRFTRSVAGGSASAIKIGDADGNRQRVSSNIMGQGMINAAHAMEFIYQFVDTPTYSVGQAIVYQMQVDTEGNTSSYFYVNRSGDDSNDTYIYRGRAFSTITAMEVSA